MKKPSVWKFVASLGCVAVFGGLAIGTTYSLFTSSKTTNTKIVIASKDTLKAELYLKELKQDVLNEEGMIEQQDMLSTIKDNDGNVIVANSDGYVDLTNYGETIFSTVKLVPTMKGYATFALKNAGDVAFTYTLDTSKKAYKADGSADSDDAAILTQVEFKAEDDEENIVKKNEYKEIKVSYEFKDDANNNDVQQCSASFDLKFVLSSISSADE